MDLSDLTGNERIVAEHAVLLYQDVVKAAKGAAHGHGMAMIEQVVREKGPDVLRRMIELSASDHPEAQKKGPAVNRARAATR